MKALSIFLLLCAATPTISHGETSHDFYREREEAEMPEGWSLLPKGRAFGVLPSDPRDLKLGLRKNTQKELEADVGAYRSIVGWKGNLAKEATSVRMGIEGNAYFEMRQEGSKFPLLSSDGLIGLFADASQGKLAYQLRYTHISAHLSDGLFSLRSPFLYTREFLSLRLAHQFDFLRAYLGYQFLTHTAPDLPRHSAQIGAYSYLPWSSGSLRPYLGADFRLRNAQEGNALQLGAGAAFLSRSGAPPMRIGASYFTGHDLRGQFFQEKLKKWSFGLDLEI